jgi:polar amino acid transport system substrate-binding protein
MKRLFFAAILLLFAVAAQGAGLKIITENGPPLNYTEDGTETGKLTGQAVEIVQDIQKRIGDATPIEVMPWARGYDMVQKEPNVMLFSTTRTPAREDLFQWVGPVGTNEWLFVTKKGSSVQVASLDDAKKVGAIGAYKNDAREQFLKEQGFTNIDSSDDPGTILKKVLSGRNDLWLTMTDEYKELAKTQKVDVSEITPVFTVKKTELYMAFSKNTDADILQKWKKGYDEMKADGTYDKIVAKWAAK